MSKENNLLQLESHFEFGENWSEYSKLINKDRIKNAEKSLTALIELKNLKDKSFLDIGCGSGLFSLAALNLGASRVLSLDIDPKSVETTQQTLTRFSKNTNYDCKVLSVFNLDSKKLGRFEIVYSWGVLHHTGHMYEALRLASQMVENKGLFVIALYRKTPFCEMWKRIKKYYIKAPKIIQKITALFYMTLTLIGQTFCGVNVFKYLTNYHKNRGMSYLHDVHDWLGGYPYESISPKECKEFIEPLGFTLVSQTVYTPRTIFGKFLQILGSGCDEYVFKKSS